MFVGLPFYHTGVKLTYPFTERLELTLAGYNGWNSVTDNNDEKSLSLQMTYTIAERISVSALYFTGVERPRGAPEGRPWRHTFDTYATLRATGWLTVLLHVNAGFEPNALGLSGWFASAGYLRFRIIEPLHLALRYDFYWEGAPPGAARISWPVAWVSSGTATVEYRPVSRISIRLEYRHDHAAGDLYFAGSVAGDGSAAPFVPNRRYQDTITLGLLGWF